MSATGTNASLAEELDKEYAEAWKPSKAGDKVVGEVVELSSRDGGFGTYPIVTLRTAEGDEYALHAIHEVLRNELAQVAPKLGDEIGVKYAGKHPDKGYHRYRVRRAGGSVGFDWRQFGADLDGDLEPIPAHALDESGAATAAALEAERDERDEAASEDIPF